jgi:hypothetical protein
MARLQGRPYHQKFWITMALPKMIPRENGKAFDPGDGN